LDASSGSISKYAVPAQMAVTLGEPTTKQLAFAKAASSQYQAEECYRYYASALRQCSLSDKKCLKKLRPTQKQCTALAESTFYLIQDFNRPDL